MVDVELIETGELLDVTDQNVVYIKRVSDIGDIVNLNTSYSWSLKFPKTPKNSMAFNGLGMKGGTSLLPYTKTYCNLRDNGIAIVRKGLLNVKETGDDWKIFIQDGIIDFLKDIGTDKIGETIDLSELEHTNDVATIVASWSLDTYRYIIASYNGPPLANESGITNLNTLALVPSINCQWLWDAIFDYYGWTYTGSVDFSNLWMTYPNAFVFDDSTAAEVMNVVKTTGSEYTYGHPTYLSPTKKFRSADFPAGTIDNDFFEVVAGTYNIKYRCTASGNYKISILLSGFVRLDYSVIGIQISKWTAKLYRNGVYIYDLGKSNEGLKEIQLTVQANDVFNIVLEAIIPLESFLTDVDYVTDDNNYFKIETLGLQDVSFSQALIKYKTIDFIKELMFRGAFTAFVDIDTQNIDFMSLDERLDADVEDWSDKYVMRKNESYLYESYMQNNYIRHKYDEEGDDYHDGNLMVTNENLGIEKTLYEGKSYAPLQELEIYQGTTYPTYYVNNFKMFDVEIKEDAETSTFYANYKPLKNRFYFMESETRVDDIYILGGLYNTFPIRTIANTTHEGVVANSYSNVSQLLDETKVHGIELALSRFDVATLDLKKVYYFRQEQAYYLLNGLKWEKGKNCTGEFIKIKR